MNSAGEREQAANPGAPVGTGVPAGAPGAAPRERPILFSGAMVRALLAGTKTQTRRLYKPRYPEPYEIMDETPAGNRWPFVMDDAGTYHFRQSPYGVVGDRLWVRERCLLGNDDCPTHQLGYPPGSPCWCGDRKHVRYAAGATAADVASADSVGWRPSIHMPRWASRITLEVTDVRVQRLQDISEDDAVAEGPPCWVCGGRVDGTSENDCACFHSKAAARDSFQTLWDSINADRAAWLTNPWVWAVSFRRLTP